MQWFCWWCQGLLTTFMKMIKFRTPSQSQSQFVKANKKDFKCALDKLYDLGPSISYMISLVLNRKKTGYSSNNMGQFMIGSVELTSVNQGWARAWSTVYLFLGSTVSSFSTKSLAAKWMTKLNKTAWNSCICIYTRGERWAIQVAGEDNSKPKLHLAITSDRVVTKISNLDIYGKQTWGIY